MLSALSTMLRETREVVRSVRMRRKGIKRAVQLKGKGGELRLDLGCGSIKRPGFVGLDLSSDADIQWDIRWGLPFDDNSKIKNAAGDKHSSTFS